MTERDAESLLPMLSTEVEHVVRFTPAWRGYARSEVDAFVTRSERELGALRGRVEDLEAALRDAESHRGETAAEAARWKAMYEDSVPPFEELGTRVAEILGLAEAEARERVRAAEDEASTLVAEAGVRAASMVTEAEQRASARETEAEQRASARETEAEERAGLLVADAERRAAELEAAAEERSAAREAAATERVDNLEREHAALVERLGGIRDVLSRLPGLGGVAAVADETPGDEVPPDVTPADDVVAAAADETPADETPADETPADETPADETPADETPADEVVAVDPDATQLFATPVDAEGPIDAREPVAADALGVEPEAADHQTASADEAEPIGEAPAAADQGVDDARQPADLEATVVGTVPAVEETTVQAAVADRGRGRPKGRR